MALSFLYIAFIRVLELLRLRSCDTTDLAIEVVLLRHEVAVLRRQVARPTLRPADRALLAGLSLWVPKISSGPLTWTFSQGLKVRSRLRCEVVSDQSSH